VIFVGDIHKNCFSDPQETKKKQKNVKIQEISVFGAQDLKKHHRSCSYIKRKLQYKYLEGDAEERSLKKPPA